MSIIRQVLGDLASAFRRAPTEKPLGSSAKTASAGAQPTPVSRPPLLSPGGSGLKAVILNWNGGENDPFTVVNGTIRQHLYACGKNVEVLEITSDWTAQLTALATAGVEFVFTWQGLGSRATVGEGGPSLWDHLRIPLICIHGDHPSHMTLNHELESRYCFHLYANADAARYSNRHFRRARSASVIDIPQLHRESSLGRREGDYFVLIKNINDPPATERFWQQRYQKPVFDAYMRAAETLKSRLVREPFVAIHDALDELIVEHSLEWLTPAANMVAHHDYHSQLDHYLRSHKTVSAVTALRQFPVRIVGRGWDRIAQSAPPAHVFEPARKMADSQELYYTRFGLVDVSPSKGLHDRTRRAMANGSGFLSSANLEDYFADIEHFEPLFFDFRPHELPEKCAAVLRDPEGHLELAQEFAHRYHNRFHFKDFVNRIDQLAKLANPL